MGHLDPTTVLMERLPELLPGTAKRLCSAQDGLAALMHTTMVLFGFRLVALDEGSPYFVANPINVLPEGWAQNGPSIYAFCYEYNQSNTEFLLKVIKAGPRTLINVTPLEAGPLFHLHRVNFLIRKDTGRQIHLCARYFHQLFYLR